MKLALYALLIATMASPVFADTTPTVDVSSLTAEQRNAVQAVANQMREKKSDAPAILQAIQGIDKDTVRGWAEAGTEAGKAVSNFAKEIGAASGDFLNSFIGKAVFILAFMNYGGGKLLQFFMNIAWFISLTPIFLYVMYRTFQRFVLQITIVKEVKYNPNIFLRLLGVNEKTVRSEKMPGVKDPDGDNIAPVFGWSMILIGHILYFWALWPTWPK